MKSAEVLEFYSIDGQRRRGLLTPTLLTSKTSALFITPDFLSFTGTCYDDSLYFQITSTLASYTVNSAYLCQYQCQIAPTCVRFTFNKVSLGCWLTTLYSGNLYIDPAYTSGPKYCKGKKKFSKNQKSK